ncbi:PucR family transcriptional regulator [Acetobacterium wieringae]|uniref:PucR family transcriptional regulator n=1 Tax=Acetobacterium wieringae TaxID=52694 RepID=UPI0020348BF5|nr:PucR family transcriptional regulator [Acetobacterium wieringae]URN85910.1 PucR family transcriptional regulator ligand-binding domain-containing protein [Acetobacterium wieringae]
MAIILADLFHATQKTYQLQLLAGATGLNTPIDWVQFTEDSATTDFLKGGELIITTGMSCDSDSWLHDFITRLIAQKSAGLILNTGRYLFVETISAAVIALCNEHHFPLFAMPWKIHLSAIMQDYGNRLFMQSYQEDRTTMAFSRLLLHPDDPEGAIDTLNSLGYETDLPYQVMVTATPDRPDRLMEQLRQVAPHCYHFRLQELFVFIFLKPDNAALRTATTDVATIPINPPVEPVYFGIGALTTSLSSLHVSFQQGLFALKVARQQGSHLCHFDDLGLFKIFFAVPDPALLANLADDSLSRLETQDPQSQLTKTLRLYLEYDGSIQAVAEASFTHRNTINYRMKKIRQILQMELVTMDEKFQLQLAFLIRDYLTL